MKREIHAWPCEWCSCGVNSYEKKPIYISRDFEYEKRYIHEMLSRMMRVRDLRKRDPQNRPTYKHTKRREETLDMKRDISMRCCHEWCRCGIYAKETHKIDLHTNIQRDVYYISYLCRICWQHVGKECIRGVRAKRPTKETYIYKKTDYYLTIMQDLLTARRQRMCLRGSRKETYKRDSYI